MKCYVTCCGNKATIVEAVHIISDKETLIFFCCSEHIIPKEGYNENLVITKKEILGDE
jgi:hypothetical protein